MNVLDEYQFQVCESLVELHYFDTEDEAKEWRGGKEGVSDVSHIEDKYAVGYSPVGVLMSKGIVKAAEYYDLRVPFDGDYQIGFNWKQCH